MQQNLLLALYAAKLRVRSRPKGTVVGGVRASHRTVLKILTSYYRR
jgi:hypothetical protein